MKKVLAFLAATTMVGMSVLADGTVFLNSYDSGHPIYYLNAGTPADGAGFYVQILANGNLISSGGVNMFALSGGDFDNSFGIIPGVTPADDVQFTIRAFKGTDYASATEKAEASWTQKVADSPAAPAPPSPAALQNPSLTITAGTTPIVPEPTTIALGMLGAAALLIRRRK